MNCDFSNNHLSFSLPPTTPPPPLLPPPPPCNVNDECVASYEVSNNVCCSAHLPSRSLTTRCRNSSRSNVKRSFLIESLIDNSPVGFCCGGDAVMSSRSTRPPVQPTMVGVQRPSSSRGSCDVGRSNSAGGRLPSTTYIEKLRRRRSSRYARRLASPTGRGCS